MTNKIKFVEVQTARELLGGDMIKYRPHSIHEGAGLMSMDYFRKEDDGSCCVENIELTIHYEAKEEDAEKLEAILEKIYRAVDELIEYDNRIANEIK